MSAISPNTQTGSTVPIIAMPGTGMIQGEAEVVLRVRRSAYVYTHSIFKKECDYQKNISIQYDDHLCAWVL